MVNNMIVKCDAGGELADPKPESPVKDHLCEDYPDLTRVLVVGEWCVYCVSNCAANLTAIN